ncbi:hypothetical protein H5410_021272 [Solanum commersonii]|uniref:Uncharacterized protein n=1 Tax=Solanum commersonii TaxID=4109 RepID=A0A9J5ZDI2_SOLCO|nr:hypothetical protein H5410_021272 [Solanum commersonii]
MLWRQIRSKRREIIDEEGMVKCLLRNLPYRVKRRRQKLNGSKLKGVLKSVKKSPVKKDKGPGPSVQKPVEEKMLTREERIVEMEKQKVLNERVFDPEILTEYGMSTLFNSLSLQN